MSNRYTIGLMNRVLAADQKLPSVQLALKFINNGVPVSDIAHAVGLSRQSIYYWFTGKVEPKDEHLKKAWDYYDSLDLPQKELKFK